MEQSPFMDRTGWTPPEKLELWEPFKISGEKIDAEIERLASQPRPSNGRRQSLIVHPRWKELGVGPGLNPGVQVSLEVLLPGEETTPIRHNSTQINFCIEGSGATIISGKRINYTQYDTWNFPSMATYRHINDSDKLHARLCYSNAAMLEKLNIHIIEDYPKDMPLKAVEKKAEAAKDEGATIKTIPLGDDGAFLMPYEVLINPDPVQSNILHWPWKGLKAELANIGGLDKNYKGRRLYMMWNPATGRHNGITPNFFATITIRPGGIVDRPHRHTSAAMNYYFQGSGHSVVEGKRYDWKAGDLMLSAPGWGVHNHASHDDTVYELTVQDQPLMIYMESLLWQEDLKLPWRLLGSEQGFATNADEVSKAS
ncbi:MAG: cupin domain-containing protein [Rhodospirillales bacterium]|nr:cupin domain-containing protein [Rhodospirillales bacterium]